MNFHTLVGADLTLAYYSIHKMLNIVIFSYLSVKETIIKCEFDKESALGTILNNPIGGGRREGPKRPNKVRPKPTKSSPPPEESLENIGASARNPILITPKVNNDIPTPNPKSAATAKIETTPASKLQVPASNSDSDVFATPTTLPISKKATRLDIRSRSPSPTVTTPGYVCKKS